jgi:exonuclease III
METLQQVRLASFNLHGLNQGKVFVQQFSSECDFIFIQEHWLAPFDLNKLDNLCIGMSVFASSAMTDVISRGVLTGRPFGGVAIFVKDSVASMVRLITNTCRYIILQFNDMLLINVYLPSSGTIGYEDEYIDCLACITNDVADLSYSHIILGGDMNLDFAAVHPLKNDLIEFADNLNLTFLYNKLTASQSSYRVLASGASSLIDHFAISKTIEDQVFGVKILDSGINFSDHCPVFLDVNLSVNRNLGGKSKFNNKNLNSFRWDKADLSQYYAYSCEQLYSVNVPTQLLTCDKGILGQSVHATIDQFYSDIVFALQNSSCATVPRKRHNFYKFWWDEELNLLKQESINSFNLWAGAGKPRHGDLFLGMSRAKLNYKSAIKKKESLSKQDFSDSLNDALLTKNMDTFWNTWRSKFGKHTCSSVINGCRDDQNIADIFASSFQSIYMPNSSARHEQLKEQFNLKFAKYDAGIIGDKEVTVELVEKCIGFIKKGKAAGCDGLTAEHLFHSHPLLSVLLSMLFNIIIKFSYVPSEFGKGIIIPLLKNHDGDKNNSDNYRGITLSPVISKVFESCLMRLFESELQPDTLQFGFKGKSSCSHALFTLRSVIENYNKSSSTVNLCALDISKAFDRVNHFALFQVLMDRKLPKFFIHVLLDWYSKCNVAVRWGGAISTSFMISAGVRQGGLLSPILFSLYMDVLIKKLRSSNMGCKLADVYFGCLLYADDIMLLSHSLYSMQHMLQICEQFAWEFDVKFNSSKSVAIRIGPRHDAPCEPLTLAGIQLKFDRSIKYLGIQLVASKAYSCSVDHLKIKFYRSFNCIYSRSTARNSELVTLELMKSYCLPFLLYATEAIELSSSAIRTLDNCVKRALYKIFDIGEWDSMISLRESVNLPPLYQLIEQRKLRFVDKLLSLPSFKCVFVAQVM